MRFCSFVGAALAATYLVANPVSANSVSFSAAAEVQYNLVSVMPHDVSRITLSDFDQISPSENAHGNASGQLDSYSYGARVQVQGSHDGLDSSFAGAFGDQYLYYGFFYRYECTKNGKENWGLVGDDCGSGAVDLTFSYSTSVETWTSDASNAVAEATAHLGVWLDRTKQGDYWSNLPIAAGTPPPGHAGIFTATLEPGDALKIGHYVRASGNARLVLPAPVPLPAPLFLLVLGIASLVGLKRVRRAS